MLKGWTLKIYLLKRYLLSQPEQTGDQLYYPHCLWIDVLLISNSLGRFGIKELFFISQNATLKRIPDKICVRFISCWPSASWSCFIFSEVFLSGKRRFLNWLNFHFRATTKPSTGGPWECWCTRWQLATPRSSRTSRFRSTKRSFQEGWGPRN